MQTPLRSKFSPLCKVSNIFVALEKVRAKPCTANTDCTFRIEFFLQTSFGLHIFRMLSSWELVVKCWLNAYINAFIPKNISGTSSWHFCKVKDDLTSLHHVNAELSLVMEQRHRCCSALCCMKSRKKGKPWFIFLHYKKHKTSKMKINPLLSRRKMLRTVWGLVLRRRITTYRSRWFKHGEWTLLVSLKTFALFVFKPLTAALTY